MINCYQFKNYISDYIDGRISYHNRILFKEHLESCNSCQGLFKSVLQTTESMRSFSKVTVSENFMSNLRNKILADRITRVQSTQGKGFYFSRIPSFVYGFAAVIIVVIIGFFILKMQQVESPSLAPVVKQQNRIIPESQLDNSRHQYSAPQLGRDTRSQLVSSGTDVKRVDSSRTGYINTRDQGEDTSRKFQDRIKMVTDEK